MTSFPVKCGALMLTVSVVDAKARLSELLDKVELGEEIVITRYGKPVAHIRQVVSSKKPLPLDKLAAFRARMPRWRESSATLLREMRDVERY